MPLFKIKKELKALGNPKKALHSARFFKTGKGEYGQGDIFLGISVPEQRKIAGKYWSLISLSDTKNLLQSKIHEHRLTALFILIAKYQKGDKEVKTGIYKLYLNNTRYINNWDLIDLSAPKIVGDHLSNKPVKRKILYRFAKSKSLWEKRIAILATYTFIRNKEFSDTLKISEILLFDKHDLIHKAVGWMLREVGKKDQKTEEDFLKKYHKVMPRTMLRYAIEKFPEKKRKFYMKK